MLKKLLKHDFKALFKYWWIVAAITVFLSAPSGKCITIIDSERELPIALQDSASIILSLSLVGLVVFAVLSEVMVFTRFYKNLFTDEGYLTFTLPVKRSDILNSKLISAVVFNFATFFVIGFDILLMQFIAYYKEIFKKEFFEAIKEGIETVFEEVGAYIFVYLLEGILIILAAAVASTLFLYICITFGSVIAKKAKVVVSIAIYLGISWLVSFASQSLLVFGSMTLETVFEAMPESEVKLMVALIALCVLLFMILLCGVCYVIEYYILDRKLNLT